MKYLKKFDTHAEYEAAKEALPTHNTSICADEQITGDTYSVVHYDEIINRSIMLKKATEVENYTISLTHNPDFTNVDYFIIDGEKVEKSTSINLEGIGVHTVYIVLKEGTTEFPNNLLLGLDESFVKVTIPTIINKVGSQSFAGSTSDVYEFKGIITATSFVSFADMTLNSFDFKHLIEIGQASFERTIINTTDLNLPILKEIKGSGLCRLNGVENITIGKFLESTVGTTFMECPNLKSVVIDSIILPEIKDGEFTTCPNLETVNIKSRNLTKVGDTAFQSCPKLKTVTLRSEVLESIGLNAFDGCTALTTVNIYALVPPTIQEDLFDSADLSTLRIRVKRGLGDVYKEAWPQYADNINAMLR